MSRPLRIEFPGALYHVTSRGDRSEPIYRDDLDRRAWLRIVGETCFRFGFRIHAYCQMTNHYHLLIETPDAKLAMGLRHLNGQYAQYFNHRHELVGHLFQGRYKAIICQKDSYLLELARYIVLNPVRASIVKSPTDWPWSSHRYVLGRARAPDWLVASLLLKSFHERPDRARTAYAQFVLQGVGKSSPLRSVSNCLLLGDEQFTQNFLGTKDSKQMHEIARVHRKPTALPLPTYFHNGARDPVAMTKAYRSLAYSMSEIARYCGVSTRTVSRAIKQHEKDVAFDTSNQQTYDDNTNGK